VRVQEPTLWARRTITMKRRRYTPEQVVRKLREGERILDDGID